MPICSRSCAWRRCAPCRCRAAGWLDCVALERVARLHRPRLLFINTALHNPTGTSLEAANAAEVLMLAARHDFHIVEDDVSRELLDGWSPSLADWMARGA